MNKNRTLLVVFTVVVMLTLGACGGGTPPSSSAVPTTAVPPWVDLAPVNWKGEFEDNTSPESFCDTVNEAEELTIYVTNKGIADISGVFNVQVNFGSAVPHIQQITNLQAGETKQVGFEIPTGCHISDCPFTIWVDSGNEVIEFNENNNSAVGHCIG